ncbi:MAG: RagB/SusD family nutrient uptake outer membrane protein [Chitinophagales bacterium]
MKKTTFSLIIIVAIFISSCEKKLNQIPISTATTATFYAQPSDFIQAVNAAYNALRGYPDRLMELSEVRSDNIYPSNNDVGRDHDPINNFAPGIASNVYVEEGWRADYSGIFKANTVLEQLTKNASFVGSTALATRLSAEARFLRAFFYFDLVKYYGKVPIVDRTVSAAEANTIPRSPVTDVYALIISDLQFAIANLPANFSGAYPSYGATDIGRATKYAAEAILAQVYMTRSGPNYGIEGAGMGLNEWNLALPLLQDIISSGVFVFNPAQYAFPVPATGIFSYSNQNPGYTTGNREAIFDVMYLTQANSGLGATYPWVLVPQDFFNAYGNPSTSGALGAPSVSSNLVSSYVSTDKRVAPTIHTTQYGSSVYPFFRKYLDTTKVPSTNSRFDWAINFIAVRYTDVLMLKAECILHGAPGTQGDVDAIVNQVRARAGLGAISNVNLDQLFDERRREFAGEGSRWFDLQRSGNLVTIMNAWRTVEDATLHKISPITANHIIYPVPQTQLDAAPGLYTQNPGY